MEIAETAKIAKGVEIARASKNNKKSESNENPGFNFAQVSCIRYPINFKKKSMLAFLDSSNEVNAIHLIFTKELSFSIRVIDIRAQKINGTMLDNYRMIVADFLVTDKINQAGFFEKTFLMANISPKIVLKIPFLILSNVDVDFLDWKLWYKIYTFKKTFPITRHVKLMSKKEFATAMFGPEYESFVVQIASFSFVASPSSFLLNVHPFNKSQIAGLITEKAFIKIFAKYLNFADIFSSDLASKLLEHTGINNQAIKLVDSQQPLYEQIYSIRLVKLETLKAHIKTNLANGFIRLSRSTIDTLIFFKQKSDGFFQFYVNYRHLSNFTIKNWYPLLLIRKLLDRLGRARRFTQLDFTSVYH